MVLNVGRRRRHDRSSPVSVDPKQGDSPRRRLQSPTKTRQHNTSQAMPLREIAYRATESIACTEAIGHL